MAGLGKTKTHPRTLLASILWQEQTKVKTEKLAAWFVQGMETFFSHIIRDYGNGCWQIACQMFLTGLLGSCI